VEELVEHLEDLLEVEMMEMQPLHLQMSLMTPEVCSSTTPLPQSSLLVPLPSPDTTSLWEMLPFLVLLQKVLLDMRAQL